MASIHVTGAREHNLRAVDLVLPRDRLIVFCGVSGSGKSSLAFDTLVREGQRRYLEASTGGGRGLELLPARVDQIEGLPPTLGLPQRFGGFGSRARVGTSAEIVPLLRILFTRAGTQHCPVCDDAITPVTHDEIVATLLELPDGTRLMLEVPLPIVNAAVVEEVQRAGFGRLRVGREVVRIEDYVPSAEHGLVRIVVDRLRIGPDRAARLHDSVRLCSRAGKGVLVAVTDDEERVFVDRPYCARDDLVLPALEPSMLTPRGPGGCMHCLGAGQHEDAPCTACDGTGLSAVARCVRWRNLTFGEASGLTVSQWQTLASIPDPSEVEAAILPELLARFGRLARCQLAHLGLSQPTDQLSRSEIQRIRIARLLASRLASCLVVLDEPCAGLDTSLSAVVIEMMRELVAAGNTVLAVEHGPQVIEAADHAVEFGPGAGPAGGTIVYQGPPRGLRNADTPTGRWLSGRAVLAPRHRPPTGTVTAIGPLGSVELGRAHIGAITGPAACGKSRLLAGIAAALTGRTVAVTLTGAEGLTRPILADRGAAKAARSTPATYVGLWDTVRELLASTQDAVIRGLSASAFSLNTEGGRCEACKGTGEQLVALGPLPDLVQRCPVCEGRRFQRDVLEVRWRGLNAAELLEQAAGVVHPVLAGHPRLDEGLRALIRVGLGHVPLGQPVDTLSGGEARLLALGRELARAHRRGAADTVYLLDDPSVGLHAQDTAALLMLLRELTEEGATVWLASVDPLVLAGADAVVGLTGRS